MTFDIRVTTSMQQTIKMALNEDIGNGDVTTNSIIPQEAQMLGHIIAKQEGVVSGLAVAQEVYHLVDDRIKVQIVVEEGARVTRGQELMTLSGPARSLLTAERTALNFLGRMSGISTAVRQFVDAVNGTRARILDTRKTAPGLREFDKLAVRLGGGMNHRVGLFDMILIKDNHIDFAGSITKAVTLARSSNDGLVIEVEARTFSDVEESLKLGVNRILLDNMDRSTMRRAVEFVAGRALLEASGNVTLANVREIAETGVDYISIGALTHSVVVFDASFDYLDRKG